SPFAARPPPPVASASCRLSELLWLGVLGEQLLLTLERRNAVALLHMTETAYLLGQRGELHGDIQAFRIQVLQQARHQRLVVLDESALGASLRRAAEWVQRRSSEPAQA